MKSYLLAFILFISSLGLPARSAAQQFRGEPDDFLQYGVGARALAMGGAFSALADDVTASVYNPAGLGFLRTNEIQMMHAPFFYSTDLDYLGMAFPLTPLITFGVSGVLLRTTGIEERDQLNQITGTGGSVYSAAYLFSVASHIKNIHIGATAKMFDQHILGHNGSTLGLDVGVIYPFYPWLRGSFVVQNLNEPSIRLVDEPDVYHPHFALGTAVFVPGNILTLTTEYRSGQSGAASFMAGGEISLTKNFKIRAGVDRQVYPNFGFGIQHAPFQFDYAFGRNDLGALHRFSLGIHFGQLFRVRVRPEYERDETAIMLGAATNQITFKVERPRFPTEWWKMIIYNRDGGVVREIDGLETPPQIFWWDLRDSLGRPIRDGIYPFEFQVKYRNGDVWSESGEIKAVNQFQEEPVQMHLQFPGNQ